MWLKKLIYLLLVMTLSSCSSTMKSSYGKLSSAEKTWVLFHPFKAKKAYRISNEALKVKDSIRLANVIGTDGNGGQLDAFKHAYWMARLTQTIGKGAAFRLGKAHERGNYQSFKKRQLEDGFLPDKPSTEMDLYNNQIGILIGQKSRLIHKEVLVETVLVAVKDGEMRILLKDEQGQFLDCNKKRIPLDALKGKWDTNKCLVPSDSIIR